MRSVVNSCFVAFVLPSSGLILAIDNTLYALCQMKPLDGRTYATKNQLLYGFIPSHESRYLYHTLFLFMYLCIINRRELDRETESMKVKEETK